jgi:hypothetical protein
MATSADVYRFMTRQGSSILTPTLGRSQLLYSPEGSNVVNESAVPEEDLGAVTFFRG